MTIRSDWRKPTLVVALGFASMKSRSFKSRDIIKKTNDPIVKHKITLLNLAVSLSDLCNILRISKNTSEPFCGN